MTYLKYYLLSGFAVTYDTILDHVPSSGTSHDISLLSDKFTLSGTLEVGSILLLVVACNGSNSFTFNRPSKHI